MTPLRYVPHLELGDTPNVVVDGAPSPSTVLALSHWPGIAAPPGLAADLSAQMVFRYLDAGADRHAPAEAVSNNHFDQDGLVSVFALVDPDAARRRRDLLVDVAAAGDFATYRFRDAARLSMVIAAFADRDDPYLELLPRLASMADDVDAHRDLWAEEDAVLTASEAAIADGRVRIDEEPELDLAVVWVEGSAPSGGGHRFGRHRAEGLHPMAVNNATGCFRVVQVRGRRYELTYRYESWVQYRSRRPLPRVDLTPLAEELTSRETDGASWRFEGVDAIAPVLRLTDPQAESSLDPEQVLALLRSALRTQPPAWDPYGD